MALYSHEPYTHAFNWRDGSKQYGRIKPGVELVWIADAPNSMYQIQPVADSDMLNWAIDPPENKLWFVPRAETTTIAPVPAPEPEPPIPPEPEPAPVGDLTTADMVGFVKVLLRLAELLGG